MALANGVQTFFLPVTASAGASMWATDVRKVIYTADAGADSTTIGDFGTGGQVIRTCDPYTTTTADLAQDLYGWAVTPADLTVTGYKRLFVAGNWVATARIVTSAVLGTNTSFTLYLYKVGTAGASRARTLIGSATATAVSVGTTATTFTATLAAAEVLLAEDESVQFSYELNSGGAAVTGRLVTFYTGTQGGVQIKVDSPALRTVIDFTGSSAGTSTASGVTGKVLPTTGTSASTSTAPGVLGAIKGVVGSAASTSTAPGVLAAVKGVVGTAAASSAANGSMAAVKGFTGTSQPAGGGGGGGTTIIPVFQTYDT